MKSYYHFEHALGNKQTIQQFLDVRIPEWIQHVKSWLLDNHNPSQSIFCIDYDEIDQYISSLDAVLGLHWGQKIINRAKLFADKAYMAENERLFATWNPVYRRYGLEFVRPGESRVVEGFEDYRPLIEERCSKTYLAV